MGTPSNSVLVLIVISAILLTGRTIQAFTGLWLLPRWLTLILLSYYPFLILFSVLNSVFFDPTEKREDSIYDWEPVLHWGYMLSIAAHFLLLFGVGLSFFAAFGIGVGGFLFVPILGYRIIRPIQVRHGGTERLGADKVVAIARENEIFSHFLRTTAAARIFVTDTQHRYRYARVCALHRFTRPEDSRVMQDTVFEVQVDMRRKRVVKESDVFQTYLHRRQEDGASVLTLPVRSEDWRPGVPIEIDRATLEQLVTVPDRFPFLDRYPLPIASRDLEAVEVTVEGTAAC